MLAMKGTSTPREVQRERPAWWKGCGGTRLGKDSLRASMETWRMSCDKGTQTSNKPGGTAKRLSPQHIGEKGVFLFLTGTLSPYPPA